MIEVKNLSKSFGNFQALQTVSFSLSEGQVLGFLGPNGAGKSTTIHILTNLQIPTSGDIYFFGDLLDRNHPEILSQLGVLYAEPSIEDYLSIKENCIILGSLYGLPDSVILERMNLFCSWFDLDPNDPKLSMDFSSGMRKKLGFILALLHHPKILILDEPFESVDPGSVRTMKKVIKEFALSGGSVFISSHILANLESLITHLIILNKGSIVLSGNYEEIKNELSTLEKNSDLETIFLTHIGEGDEKEIHFPWS